MGILDQIFSRDPAAGRVQVSHVTPSDWNVTNSALFAHEAMRDGLGTDPEGYRGIHRALGRQGLMHAPSVFNGGATYSSIYGGGTVSAVGAIKISNNYRKILTQEIMSDARFKPTAEDVLDSGIKNGSKVIIKVVPENEGNIGSWDDIVRTTITDNKGTPKDLTFDKFSVISLSETDEQRYNLHQTFGADIIQTFGTRPRFLTISGQVLNGRLDVSIRGEIRSMDWKNAFQRFYEQHYSAHACTRRGKKVRIFAQDTIYEGYMLSMSTVTSAADQGISQVSIQMVMKSRDFPRNNDDKIPGFIYAGGFAITGGSVPEDYFPQPSLELYFNSDYTTAVEWSLWSVEDEIFALQREMITEAEASRSYINDYREGFWNRLDEVSDHTRVGDEFAYIQPAAKFTIHGVYADSGLVRDIKISEGLQPPADGAILPSASPTQAMKYSLLGRVNRANAMANKWQDLLVRRHSLKKIMDELDRKRAVQEILDEVKSSE